MREPRGFREVLEAVQRGEWTVEEGLRALGRLSAEDLGYARLDHHRALRKGFPEVVYCEGKTPEQAAEILERLARQGGNVLGTRAEPRVAELLRMRVPECEYDPLARTVVIRQEPRRKIGDVLVVCAGTSDLPVAREAMVTAELMGARAELLADVGVAGLHRLLTHLDRLYRARVIVVVAGMEGALVSVVAGLVDKPVIGVPTSVGYGAQWQGLTPLMGMLASCAPGVAVVNIDNGFGAGYMAALINGLGESA
ncbi:MAG: nickel pincer cofactor biosynthesis protein LarB [Kyrpidia tusciae]|nr:nickel pincer cofactor biosynthesis protein LarB [Kyrpidia tusciae]MBE3551457.1 nickel pincer cofactor biosynthesis protein LarB [Kyrpidia tusciae]